MTTRKRAKSRQVQRLVRRWSDAEVDAISDVIHTRVQLYNADGRPANGEMLHEIETALRQETKPNVPVRRGCKPSLPVVCSACGKPEESPLHIKYGPDLDNPRKHQFTSNAPREAGAVVPSLHADVGPEVDHG